MIWSRRQLGIAAVAAVAAVMLLFGWRNPMALFIGALLVITAVSTVSSLLEYRWRTYTSNTPEAKQSIGFPKPVTKRSEELTFFTIIIPAYHESSVLEHTLEVLARQNYPRDRYEVIVTLRDDDPETAAVAYRAAKRHQGLIAVRLGYYDARHSNKPSQMNAVLKYAQGDYVVPFDAEDVVMPDLLRHVDALIAQTGADVIQGGVQLTNLDNEMSGLWWRRAWQYITNGWFAVHNVMEYRFWFSSRMFYQTKLGFVPLGGNTVFIRTDLLRQIDGWDIECLTEDADLGVRLSVEYGAKIVAAYDPALATREHTPPCLTGRGSWLNQRIRWSQGFWQVLRRTPWYKLPTIRQRAMALYILGTPLLQAFNAFVLPVAILAAFTMKAPVPFAMLMFVPLIPMALTMSVQLLELRPFSKDFNQQVKLRHYVSLVLGFLPYQIMLGLAATLAVIREARGVQTWSKTARSEQIHLLQTNHLSPEGGTA